MKKKNCNYHDYILFTVIIEDKIRGKTLFTSISNFEFYIVIYWYACIMNIIVPCPNQIIIESICHVTVSVKCV